MDALQFNFRYASQVILSFNVSETLVSNQLDDDSRADTYSVIRNQMSEKLKCRRDRNQCTTQILTDISFSTSRDAYISRWKRGYSQGTKTGKSYYLKLTELQVKHFYASCTDVKTIENRTEQPLLAVSGNSLKCLCLPNTRMVQIVTGPRFRRMVLDWTRKCQMDLNGLGEFGRRQVCLLVLSHKQL